MPLPQDNKVKDQSVMGAEQKPTASKRPGTSNQIGARKSPNATEQLAKNLAASEKPQEHVIENLSISPSKNSKFHENNYCIVMEQ